MSDYPEVFAPDAFDQSVPAEVPVMVNGVRVGTAKVTRVAGGLCVEMPPGGGGAAEPIEPGATGGPPRKLTGYLELPER